MGKAYDYSFRPVFGDPDPGSGGGCDERPHRVEMFAAGTDPTSAVAEWRSFGLCAEHESQLRSYDARLLAHALLSRFRAAPAARRGGS
jgi:hypothetical protein